MVPEAFQCQAFLGEFYFLQKSGYNLAKAALNKAKSTPYNILVYLGFEIPDEKHKTM